MKDTAASPPLQNPLQNPTPLGDYDAIMLVSYGGPDSEAAVLPFMRNATAGAGIPDARLAEVSTHYQRFGGISPINACNRALAQALGQALNRRGYQIKVAVGNRNWHPYFHQTLTDLHAAGARRVLTVFTSAYACYSGCRQYRQDLHAALAAPLTDLRLDRVGPYANTPGFIAANARKIASTLSENVTETKTRDPHIALVTHSIPLVMDQYSGTAWQGQANQGAAGAAAGATGLPPALFEEAREASQSAIPSYSQQHRLVAQAIMDQVKALTGKDLTWDISYCSRSGPPEAKWLEPDINDHLQGLKNRGIGAVIVAPFGFISDHMEVVFDLDIEAAQTARDLGIKYWRAPTVGTDELFINQLADLIEARAGIGSEAAQCAPNTFALIGESCGPGCCQYPRTRPGTRLRPEVLTGAAASPQRAPQPNLTHKTNK